MNVDAKTKTFLYQDDAHKIFSILKALGTYFGVWSMFIIVANFLRSK